MEDCIFCKIIKGEIPSFKVYEDEKVLAFEDINPVTDGHTLLIPKTHAKDLWEINEESLIAIQVASKKVIRAIKEVLDPTGVAALQLNGKGAGQVVDHYHLHLIPRLKDSPPLPMSQWELRQGDMEKIQQTAQKIDAAIKSF